MILFQDLLRFLADRHVTSSFSLEAGARILEKMGCGSILIIKNYLTVSFVQEGFCIFCPQPHTCALLEFQQGWTHGLLYASASADIGLLASHLRSVVGIEEKRKLQVLTENSILYLVARRCSKRVGPAPRLLSHDQQIRFCWDLMVYDYIDNIHKDLLSMLLVSTLRALAPHAGMVFMQLASQVGCSQQKQIEFLRRQVEEHMVMKGAQQKLAEAEELVREVTKKSQDRSKQWQQAFKELQRKYELLNKVRIEDSYGPVPPYRHSSGGG